MMKLNTFAPKKTRAQAMVEFAIVLPLLLLLLYGILEAGRLLFMYSTIVTATRQASRYGSATGQGGDYTSIGGPDNRAYPRYQDCYGIRLAADRVDFLNSFDLINDLTIAYDNGEGTPVTDFDGACDGDADPDVKPSTNNDTRIVVTVDGNFFPIVPRLVPFIERSNANGNPISATSARTIIIAISIEVTPPPGSGPPPPGTNQLSLSMTASPTTYAFAGETINFTYTATNNGTVELTGLALTPTHGVISGCDATTLAPGASTTCYGSYVTTSTDVANGSIPAQATATASDGTNVITSNTATVTVTWEVRPELQLAKTASTEYATTGGVITYTFTLTNSGNVPLTAPMLSDPLISNDPFACGADLAPSTSTSCTASYTVSSQDVRDDELVNNATASATYGAQTVTSNTASATVYTGPLFLRATASPTSLSAPGTITYTYELVNNTGVILYPPYTLSGYRGTENCSTNTSPIPVGGSITCSGTYSVTQTDLNNNASLNDNNIRATGCTADNNCSGSKNVSSNSDSVSVILVRTPGLALTIASVTPNPATTLGTVITYLYTVSNTGNVTLTPTITDTRVGTVACPALAPATTDYCAGSYTVTQADLDAGSITNQATATALFAGTTYSSASQSFTVITYPGPRARLGITPNPISFTGVGQFIVYTYTITNTGDRPLIGPYIVSDSKVTFVDCAPATSPLPIGASTTCVGSYATTQADMDTGHIINSASITASDGTQVVTSNSAMAVVYVPGAPTLTPTQGPTAIPTATRTPTAGPTEVTACDSITLVDTPPIAIPGVDGNRTMSMRFRNPNSYSVTVLNVVVSWNANGGPGANGSTLTLQNAKLNNTQFWNGPSNSSGGPLTLTPSTTLTIPGNNATSTIVFTFDAIYQTAGNPSITINLSTPGCTSTPIKSP
jgi:uncharacterized repeat protein (TIGR01451 family)